MKTRTKIIIVAVIVAIPVLMLSMHMIVNGLNIQTFIRSIHGS